MTYPEFKKQFHIQLNPQQEEAVRQTEGPVLLLAVPGSGKTTVLVSRLGWMLYGKQIAPEHILTVTYTVAATRDMRHRFEHRFGPELADRLTFRTINGLCAVVIQTYAARKNTIPFALADDESHLNRVVRELLTQGGVSFPSEQQIKEVRTHITYCKNQMLTEGEIQEHRVDGMDFPSLYRGYQAYLRSHRLMDYDDQMVFAHRIFRQYPDILDHFRRRWPYLCVDEAQDTSKIQHAILRLLAAPANNIFMVGDEDQSIYGFRAAFPQALLGFEQTYPGAKVLLMETNYRSTRSIVEKADAFIQRNKARRPKHMTTNNPEGTPIRKIPLSDYNRQYSYLLKAARECTVSTAILYRNNDSALPLIDLLEKHNVPYRCRQREGFFFTSPLVRDLTDMLRFAFDDGNRELFLNFYYKLDLKMKKTVMIQLLQFMAPEDSVFEALLASEGLEPWQMGKVRAMQTHFSKLPQLTSFAALQRLVKFMGYGDYLNEQHADTTKLDILLSLANQNPEPDKFLNRLEELKGVLQAPSSHTGCPLVLSTIHASKGLEYDRVILIDVADGIFPALSPDGGSQEESALEEERRLFYVGVTRARRQLDLLCYGTKFGSPGDSGSTFIRQLLGEKEVTPPKKEVKPLSLPKSPSIQQVAGWEKDYIPGTPVIHKAFGRGTLVQRTGSIVLISFERESVGNKKMDLPTCLRQGLIQLASEG